MGVSKYWVLSDMRVILERACPFVALPYIWPMVFMVSILSLSDTSLTNFSAFLLGSVTSLPAVEYFSIYAATTILFDFLLQVRAASLFVRRIPYSLSPFRRSSMLLSSWRLVL